MGVTVLQIFPDESRHGYKAVERLHSRIGHLGAVPSGMFCVDCETYYCTSNRYHPEAATRLWYFSKEDHSHRIASMSAGGIQTSKKLHILHNSETPVTTNAIIDTGSKQVVLSSDLLFDLLLPRLSHMYQSKKNLKIESKGYRFEIGDFVVKVGTVTMSNIQYKGILVEVEYLPCVVPDQCWNLIREFMQSFMGSCVPSETPRFIQNHFREIYTPQDTVQQYLEKFNEFREGNSSVQIPQTSCP